MEEEYLMAYAGFDALDTYQVGGNYSQRSQR